MRDQVAKRIAVGGLLAAVAVVIMCMGGLIPIATYVCPMLCTIVQFIVLHICGKRTAWSWYVCVSILSILLSPDKEAALIFVLLGYYPMLKPIFEKSRFRIPLKLLLFNSVVILLYALMLRFLGLDNLVQEYQALGTVGLIVMLVLGNVTFMMLDHVLTVLTKKKFKKQG